MTNNLLTAPATDETALALPQFLNGGLAANDRLKYYLTLLQMAGASVHQPRQALSDLHAEREASGITDPAFDEIVAGSRPGADGYIHIPRAQQIRALLLDGLHEMLQPVQVAAHLGVGTLKPVDTYAARLAALTAHLPSCADDRLTPTEIATVTGLGDSEHDSMHRLVVDLHRELNQLQTNVFRELVDGAKTYGLTDVDRELVRAFMTGVNATAARKFDHPGLGTVATRSGDRLSIQNDLGTTDVHLLVIHIRDLTATIIYSDIHGKRLRFFQNMLEPCGVTWAPVAASPSGTGTMMVVGQITAVDRHVLSQRLSLVGSRLVFLIDWNRARKCLKRFISASGATAVLKAAADQNIGHRGFLQAGGAQLIYTALERVARSPVRRLDEMLGPDAARAFLLSVMRLTAEGLAAGRSPALVQDQIEVALLAHLVTTEQSTIGLAAEHAMVLAAIAQRLRYVLMRASTEHWQEEVSRCAELCDRWECKANEIVDRSQRLHDQRSIDGALRQLVRDADNAADALEEYAFGLTLLTVRGGRDTVPLLSRMTNAVERSVREYVRCLEYAQCLPRQPIGSDVEEVLVGGDRVTQLARECRAIRRTLQLESAREGNDPVELQLTWQAAMNLEVAAASLAHCTSILRDYALTEVSSAHE